MIFSDFGIPGAKLDVTYDGEETLKAFHVTELPSYPPVYGSLFPQENSFSMSWLYSVNELRPGPSTCPTRSPSISNFRISSLYG